MADKTQAKRQSNRRAQLNEAARLIGFSSWSKFETAVINGQYVIMEGNHERKSDSNQNEG